MKLLAYFGLLVILCIVGWLGYLCSENQISGYLVGLAFGSGITIIIFAGLIAIGEELK